MTRVCEGWGGVVIALGGLVGYLSLSTDRAGGDKVLNVLPHLQPTELALYEGSSTACARVTGELSPL